MYYKSQSYGYCVLYDSAFNEPQIIINQYNRPEQGFLHYLIFMSNTNIYKHVLQVQLSAMCVQYTQWQSAQSTKTNSRKKKKEKIMKTKILQSDYCYDQLISSGEGGKRRHQGLGFAISVAQQCNTRVKIQENIHKRRGPHYSNICRKY